MDEKAVVSLRGARRWRGGHPWIFRSDIIRVPGGGAGSVPVEDQRGNVLGRALYSPRSEITLRMVDSDPTARLNAEWWYRKLETALAARSGLAERTNAYRVSHGEGDALPSLVCDRYDSWLVVQLLSAGVEAHRIEIVSALVELLQPRGILARHDVPVRTREGLERGVELITGEVPHDIEVVEDGVHFLAAPWDGQKTGAFLDQRDNRLLAGSVARGECLDCFSYHGSFALHMAAGGGSVTAVDSSATALERASRNAALNGFGNVRTLEVDVFEHLRSVERSGAQYDTVVVDPPALAKNRAALAGALRGYKELNLRALRVVRAGGYLVTASCSYHLSKGAFLSMLSDAASDSGRRVLLRELLVQPEDHPEVLTVPETGYLKGALLQVVG